MPAPSSVARSRSGDGSCGRAAGLRVVSGKDHHVLLLTSYVVALLLIIHRRSFLVFLREGCRVCFVLLLELIALRLEEETTTKAF